MNLTTLALRFRWLQMPTGLLILLLQRTPLLRVLVQSENPFSGNAPAILRSAFAVAAMGSYNALAGATTFTVNSATGSATGAAKSTFQVTGTVGTALNGATGVTMTVSGAPGTPKSFGVTDNAAGTNYTNTLPPGLSVNPVTGTTAGGAPYFNTGVKLTVNGTPTTAGTYTVRFWASDSTAIAGGNSAYVIANFTITGGVANVAPSITTQPTSQTVTAGGAVSFTVAASGTPKPTYQWQKGGATIAGATSAIYSIASTVVGDAGNYTAVATNSAGSATSTAATLTVNPAVTAPAITTQPTNLTVAPGSAASFTVAASGNPTPTYQWKKGGVNIAGATSATYSIASVVAGDAANYTVVATNSAGSATSSTATLTVTSVVTAPAITTQPANLAVTTGGAASFTVAASGTPTPTYQWQKGGVNIAGATSTTYAIASVVAGDAGNYTVVATNSAGSATSVAATLTVSVATIAPTFTTQPMSGSVTVGSPVSFTVAANGNPTPTYQWQKGGVNIAGATSGTYSIVSAVAGDAGSYSVVATNSVGSATSSAATLTVSATTTAPSITTQPVSLTVAAGSSASFTVAASGKPTPTYQWYFGGAAIGGATNATLTLSNVQAANAGDYYANATNSAGSAISTSAKLTVQASIPVTLLSSQLVVVGHDVAISASGASGPMQWQVSGDSGLTWQNLADNSTYSGVATSTLEILRVSAGMHGSLYRCQVAGTASSATTLSVVQGYFTFPTAVGADSTGNLYVSDGSAHTVQKLSSSGQVTLVAGSAGAAGSVDGSGANARFNQPGALAVAPDGTLSVSDTTNQLIRSINLAGSVTVLAGTTGSSGSLDGTGAGAKFSSPLGIARDSSGILFVADSLNHAIRKISTSGAVTTFAGSAGVAGSTDGTGTSARFNNPAGVAVDSSGNVYVADAANNTIRKITSAGAVSTLAGLAGARGSQDGTASGARFNNPGGLTLGSGGDLYLADTGNSIVRKITSAGVVTTIAGLPGIPGLMDGTGGYAWFDQPEGLTLGTDGNLYVADTGNAVIRKVTLAGSVTTMALTTGASSPSSTPAAPSPATTSPVVTSAGAGGGAIEGWFVSLLALVALLRPRRRQS